MVEILCTHVWNVFKNENCWNYSKNGSRGIKENDGESIISKYNASVQVDDIIIHTESCLIIGGRREKVSESNREGRTDKCTIYSQLRYVE
jgi:hypothetical protein